MRGGVGQAHHEELLAERAGALAEDVVGRHGDDGGEREDEGVDVRHVEVVGRDGVRDGVRGHGLRLRHCAALVRWDA